MNAHNELYHKAKSVYHSPLLIKNSFFSDTKGLNFKYLRYRVFRPLIKTHFKIYRLIKRPAPWIAPQATEILKSLLRKDMIGIEYGSGVSTIFLASRIRRLVSFEHYDPWFKKVNNLLSFSNITNVDQRLIIPNFEQPRVALKHDFDIPNFHYSTKYFNYYEAIKEYDEQFDFALIDGRARVETALNCWPKIKEGGFLILDNSERDRYKPLFSIFSEYPCIQTTTGLTDTTFWFKTKHQD
jgi:hypothetical protein